MPRVPGAYNPPFLYSGRRAEPRSGVLRGETMQETPRSAGRHGRIGKQVKTIDDY
ncbi:MAG TPA: hypothetical protein GXZ36_09685 [Firmicutes bacterium]|nr:hypothetical protein [Bacillota bacterium]